MSDTPQIELTEEALGAAAEKAIAAFEAASDLDELTSARREHLGDGGYIPQARWASCPRISARTPVVR